jgi:hypothetical protein
MASGKPLHAVEKRVIEQMQDEKFPTIIARHLTMNYSQYNGGSRATSTVQAYIRALNRKEREVREVKPSPSFPPTPSARKRAPSAPRS